MKKTGSGAVYIISAAVLWGFFPVFTRMLYAEGISVADAVAARAIVAALTYLIWGLLGGVFKGLKGKDYLFLAFYGVCSVLGTYLFYALAIKYLSAAMAAMLLYTAPAFVILFDRLLYGEPITRVKLIALAAAFIGSCLVVRIYDLESLVLNWQGIVLGLLAGISYSMLTVIGRKAIGRGYTPLQNTFVPSISVGLIFCVAVPPWTIAMPSAKVALCYLAVGIIGSVLPYFFYLKGLSSGIGGAAASILANVEPVAATLFGMIFFADTLELWQILGMAIVLFGAAIPSLSDRYAGKIRPGNQTAQ